MITKCLPEPCSACGLLGCAGDCEQMTHDPGAPPIHYHHVPTWGRSFIACDRESKPRRDRWTFSWREVTCQRCLRTGVYRQSMHTTVGAG